MRREKRAATPADELRRLLNTNHTDGSTVWITFEGFDKGTQRLLQAVIREKMLAKFRDFIDREVKGKIAVTKPAGQVKLSCGNSGINDSAFLR